MTQISRDDVLHQARLSGLELTDEEAAVLEQDIPRIIDYFEQLNELDTDGVLPTLQLNNRSNVWREDTVDVSLPKSALLQLAPCAREDQISVSKVLDR